MAELFSKNDPRIFIDDPHADFDWLGHWFAKTVWKRRATFHHELGHWRMPQELDAAAHIVRNCELSLVNPPSPRQP